ncbi:MAG: hypothetical protein K9M99_02805 [Candidatus Cloacimonetes bacterium]|nr:hypothetical protein [Candidatus Cloacimonadota bacterium]
MRVFQFGGKRYGYVSLEDTMKTYGYTSEATSRDRIIRSILQKDDTGALAKVMKQKAIAPVVSIRKMLGLLDVDGYHSGACGAISDGTIMHFKNTEKCVKDWIANSQNPMNLTRSLRTAVNYYQACGNAFLMKLRDRTGKWVGIELMLPHEIEIRENIDENGFMKPNYVQRHNNKLLPILNRDMIHIKKPTYKSKVWGLSSLPVAYGLETLKEIKTLDHNNFKNGLLIDYFIFLTGGTVDELEDEDGDGYTKLEKMLKNATGTKSGHSSIFLEIEETGAKIELVPMRGNMKDGEYQKLKEDIRNEVLAYHNCQRFSQLSWHPP